MNVWGIETDPMFASVQTQRLIMGIDRLRTDRLFRGASIGGFLVCLAGYVAASHWPTLSTESAGLATHSDKPIHLGVYTIITCWLFMLLRPARGNTILSWKSFALVMSVAVFALADEATQPIFDRHFEWIDLSADMIGITTGAALGLLMPKFLRSIAVPDLEKTSRD